MSSLRREQGVVFILVALVQVVGAAKAINKPEDMKGLKIRIPDAPF